MKVPSARNRWSRIAVLAVLALALAGCKDEPKPPAATGNSTDPAWVSQASPPAKVAVVFIHGIFGDTLGTWSNDNGSSMFKQLKAAPQVGPHVDVFAFGFTSKMFGSGSLDIREAANKLHESLQFKGVLDYPAIVLVGHSMGGLIALRYLISEPDVAAKVPLVVLYAAPQEGAQIAAIADGVARNNALVQMFPADRNAYLQQLSDDWGRLDRRPAVACGYESKATHGTVVVVPWSSATRFCSETPIAIEDADHISIVKPDRLEHPSVVLLVNALDRHVIGKNFAARLETPDFTPEGDHHVIVLNSNQRHVRLVNRGRSKLQYTVSEIADPNLYIVPDDTPRELAGEQTQRLGINLLAGADAAEYRFTLRTDVPSEQRVIVRVPNIADVRKQQAELMGSIVRAIDDHVADPGNAASLRALGTERAFKVAAGLAFDTVKKRSPWQTDSANWLVAADLLAAANWPRVATTALRQAEAASLATAAAPSAQLVAGVVAAQSGQAKVFASLPNPVATNPPSKTLHWLDSPAQQQQTARLAARLQTIPPLRASGLVLQGDVLDQQGNKEAARRAYMQANALESTPSITTRVRALDAKGSAVDVGKKTAVAERPGVGEAAAAKATADPTRPKAAEGRASERP